MSNEVVGWIGLFLLFFLRLPSESVLGTTKTYQSPSMTELLKNFTETVLLIYQRTLHANMQH